MPLLPNLMRPLREADGMIGRRKQQFTELRFSHPASRPHNGQTSMVGAAPPKATLPLCSFVRSLFDTDRVVQFVHIHDKLFRAVQPCRGPRLQQPCFDFWNTVLGRKARASVPAAKLPRQTDLRLDLPILPPSAVPGGNSFANRALLASAGDRTQSRTNVLARNTMATLAAINEHPHRTKSKSPFDGDVGRRSTMTTTPHQ